MHSKQEFLGIVFSADSPNPLQPPVAEIERRVAVITHELGFDHGVVMFV